MATYKVKDPQTGKTVSLKGDSPPTEQELEQVFSIINGSSSPAPAQPESSFVSDVGKNAVREAKGIVKGLPTMAAEGLKIASLEQDAVKYPIQRFLGRAHENTSLGEGLRTISRTVKASPQTTIGLLADVADTVIRPIDSLREKPISTVATIAPMLKGAAVGTKALARMAASEAPNLVEQFGARGVLSSIGVTPKTIEKIAGKANPAEVGNQLGKRLVDEGAIGSTAKETFSKFKEVRNQYGKAVDESLNQIKIANRSLGVYPELEDSLKVKSIKIMKPINDRYIELANSPYAIDQRFAKSFKAAYGSLFNKAKANKGFLTLDNVREELKRVGKLFNRAAPESEDYQMASELYGSLADVVDFMVKDIAERVSNPKLAENLIKANEGYSTYTRLWPDVRRSAAKEAVGSTGIFRAPVKAVGQMMETPISRAAVKVGGIPRKISKFIRQ